MKKILAAFLALSLMLGMSVPAYAEVKVDGDTKSPSPVTHDDDAHCVSADASGDELTVTGDVTGEYGVNSIDASDRAEIIVIGTVTNDIDDSGYSAVYASSGANVSTGNVIAGSGNLAIYALGEETTVTAEGVEESGDIFAAIYVEGGATVTVNGDVTEDGAGDAINATDRAEVTVEGNVTESDDGYAIYADNSTVTVEGNVIESGDNNAIYANGTSTVKVGGNVDSDGRSSAINASNGAVVIVEGLVAYDITNSITNSGTIYLGQLGRNIINSAADNIHYLIGIAPAGSAALSTVTLVSDIVAEGTVDGVNEKGYKYTTTANKTALSGQTITLKPAAGKALTVSGYDGANVSYVANADGTVTFTLGDNFKGGLQNLVLVITDKPTPDPQPTPSPSEPDPQPVTPVTSPVQYAETGNPAGNYVANDPAGSNMPLPYITTNGSKAGWQTIGEALDAHKANYKGKKVEALSVTMNGSATIDTKLITDAHDKMIPLSFVLDDEVTVGIPTANSVLSNQAKEGKPAYFKVSSMTTAEATSINRADAGLLPSDLVAIGGNENTPVVLTLCSNDKVSTDKSQLMTIKFNANRAGYKKGDKVYLYCGTSLTGIAMYKSGKVDKNGFVTFSVPMVSNYWTIGNKNMNDTLLRNN